MKETIEKIKSELIILKDKANNRKSISQEFKNIFSLLDKLEVEDVGTESA